MSDDALIEAMAMAIHDAVPFVIKRQWVDLEPVERAIYVHAATRLLAAIRKTHAVVPREQAHRERQKEIMRLMREDFDPTPPNWEGREWYDNAEDVADKIEALFRPPQGDVADPQAFEKHDPTNPFAPRERPKKSIRLMTDAERRAAGLDPNGGFDGPTGAD